jgi:hypothetical protein
MPFPIASHTNFHPTLLTPPHLPSPAHILNLFWFNPVSTPLCGTVDSIVRSVFLVLLIPLSFELYIEELLNMLEGDMIGRAAPGRHVLRVSNREGEDAPETSVTHSVGAG